MDDGAKGERAFMSINQRAATARESARQRNGEFGEQLRSAPEAELVPRPDLTAYTPVDIDKELNDLLSKLAPAQRGVEWAGSDLSRAEKALTKVTSDGERYDGQMNYLVSTRDRILQELEATQAVVEGIYAEMEPYEAEFTRRGGWPRAFITTGSAPHVHSSMDCSTCNKMGQLTRFGWLTQYSGKTEEEIVNDAGDRACTTCYPTAPVDVLARPTKMFTEDEERRERERDERTAAKTERIAESIRDGLTPDGSELVIEVHPADEHRRRQSESFKTERSAVIWATDHFRGEHGLEEVNDAGHQERLQTMYSEYNAAVRQIAEAVAVKHGRPVEYVLEEFAIKADLKRKVITAKQGKDRLLAAAERWGVR